MKRLFLPLTIALVVATALGQEPPRTTRDAYLEGWFLETAEGKLTDALKSYQRAVEVGGDQDRELVAKALWRIGRIARARGDRTAARAQFERVVQEYGDTDAAALARADLEDDGAKKAAIPDARRQGIEQLAALLAKPSDQITAAEANRVLLTVSAEDIAATYRQFGGSLVTAIAVASAPELCGTMIDLYCQRVDFEVSQSALMFLRAHCEDVVIPDRIVDAARQEPADIGYVVDLLARREAPEDMSRAISLVGAASERSAFPSVINRLFTRASADDARLFDAILGQEFATGSVTNLLPGDALADPSPLGDVLRRRFATLTPSDRVALGRGVTDTKLRAALDVLLADPEPRARHLAIYLLMASADDAERREGFERYLAEPPPYDIQFIQSVVTRSTFPVTEATFDLVPAGSLRELLYSSLMNGRAHSIADVIAVGLRRGDPELVPAVLETTYWRDPRLVLGDSVPNRGPRDSVTIANFTIVTAVNASRLRDDLATHPDEALGRKLAEAVALRGTESMRATFVFLIGAFHDYRAFAGALERFARDPSAAIRRSVASSFSANDLGEDVRRDLLLDEDGAVAGAALDTLATATVLAAAIRVAPEPRIDRLVDEALERKWVEPVRAGYERLPATNDLAWQCLERLANADIDLALAALDREPAGNLVTRHAAALVQPFAPPDLALILGMVANGQTSAEDPACANAIRALRDAAEPIRERHRSHRIEEIVHAVRMTPQMVDLRSLAETLAELGAVETARELVRGGSNFEVETGARALILLHRVDDLRDAFRASASPDALLDAAIEAGLTDDVVQALRDGRLGSTVLPAVLRAGRHDVLADLLCPKDARVGRVEPWGPFSSCMRAAIAVAAEEGDPGRLANAVVLYDATDAVRALFQIGAIDRILADLPRWPKNAVTTAFQELRRRTGIPANADLSWPNYRAEQEALIGQWRTALGR